MNGNWKAGFIGCGNMGGALAAVAAKSLGGDRVLAADHNAAKTEKLRESCGVVPTDAATVAAQVRFLFLGVKPQVMEKAASEIRGVLREREPGSFVVITMAAGLTAAKIADMLDGAPVIRIMPNTPAAVGEGVILYCLGDGVTAQDEADFLTMMAPAGLVVPLEEGKIDMGSALTGCGPAFVYLFVEGLVDGAVRCGLPREKATRLALQTVSGAAKLALETGRDPALLRGDVCSPAGSTIEGVAALEARGVRAAAVEAVSAAYRRTVELGK